MRKYTTKQLFVLQKECGKTLNCVEAIDFINWLVEEKDNLTCASCKKHADFYYTSQDGITLCSDCTRVDLEKIKEEGNNE